jgi:uncharacterized membrane protein YkgB
MDAIHTIQYKLSKNDESNVICPHYKIIILVIASHSHDYDLFSEQWLRYMNEFPEVRAFFLYSDVTIESDILVEDNKITYKFAEWFEPGILFKTIAGFYVCNKLFTYDHMLRTNLSSFIHIPRLISFLGKVPKTDYVAAKQDEFREGIWFLSGAGFIVSRDIVFDIVKEVFEKKSIDEEIKYAPDDVALTKLIKLSRSNILFEKLDRYDCNELIDSTTVENVHCFHIRNKTEWKYHNRIVDIKNMTLQVDNLLSTI